MKKLKLNEIEDVIALLEEMHPDAKCALDYDNTYHLLISVVLSAQATDVSVNLAVPALFAKYPEPEDIAAIEPEELEPYIKTIGLYKTKARNIVKLARTLVNDYNGQVPDSFDELIKLPGVGRKTANVMLAEAFGCERIAVDTHVYRVSNRIGITAETDVLSTEKSLMKRLPKGKWTRTHHLLIFHGRRICDARRPKCEECLLNNICRHNDFIKLK